MKYIFGLIHIIFFIGCSVNEPDTLAKRSSSPEFNEVTNQVLSEVEGFKLQGIRKIILPGQSLVVEVDFENFQVGDTVTVTTREGKKGYPFYEPIDGKYHYWLLTENKIIPVAAEKIALTCKAL